MFPKPHDRICSRKVPTDDGDVIQRGRGGVLAFGSKLRQFGDKTFRDGTIQECECFQAGRGCRIQQHWGNGPEQSASTTSTSNNYGQNDVCGRLVRVVPPKS